MVVNYRVRNGNKEYLVFIEKPDCPQEKKIIFEESLQKEIVFELLSIPGIARVIKLGAYIDDGYLMFDFIVLSFARMHFPIENLGKKYGFLILSEKEIYGEERENHLKNISRRLNLDTDLKAYRVKEFYIQKYLFLESEERKPFATPEEWLKAELERIFNRG